MSEEMRRNRLFERGPAGHSILADAAQLDPQFQLRTADIRRFPQNIKTDGGTLIGVTAKISLVGVAVVQARRQSLLAFEVEKKRQDFDDAARDGIAGEGR